MESRELVVAALDGYAEIANPTYENARHELHQSLVGNVASIGDVAAEADERRKNSKLLTALVGTLPQSFAFDPESRVPVNHAPHLNAFLTRDPAEAVAVHASVIYHPKHIRDHTDNHDSTWKEFPTLFAPSVIVGSRRTSKRATELLLHTVAQYDHTGISGATVKTSHYEHLADLQAGRHVKPFSREQMKAMLDDRGRLQLGARTPGALRTTHPLRLKEKLKANDTASWRTDLQKTRLGAAGIERFGLQFTPLALDKNGPSDYDLARYDVFEHLSELAVRFGRTAAFKEILLNPGR